MSTDCHWGRSAPVRCSAPLRPRLPACPAPLAPGHHLLRDTLGHTRGPHPCAHGRRAWQGGSRWRDSPRPLGTGETHAGRRRTGPRASHPLCTREGHPRHTPGSRPCPPIDCPAPPATPCKALRPAPDADAWTVEGDAAIGAPHRLTPADAGGTAPRPRHDETDTPGPPHRATRAARGACETVQRPHESPRVSCHAPRTLVTRACGTHRGRPHGTDAPWRAHVRGNDGSNTHPLCHGARCATRPRTRREDDDLQPGHRRWRDPGAPQRSPATPPPTRGAERPR